MEGFHILLEVTELQQVVLTYRYICSFKDYAVKKQERENQMNLTAELQLLLITNDFILQKKYRNQLILRVSKSSFYMVSLYNQLTNLSDRY